MHKPQVDVKRFHEVCDITIGKYPSLREGSLRAELIREEAVEAVQAIKNMDFEGAIKELCDLLYVTLGTAITWGIDLEPFFDEVHRSNMTKVGGPIREDGKRLKPDDYEPADLSPELARQIRRAAESEIGTILSVVRPDDFHALAEYLRQFEAKHRPIKRPAGGLITD